MIRKAILCASLCLLTSCAGLSSPAPPIPQSLPIDQPKPKASDPAVCVPVKPEPAIQGGIVRPAGPVEEAAYNAFLTSVRAVADWGEQLAAQVGVARKQDCPSS